MKEANLLDLLKSAIKSEIENNCTLGEHSVNVNLPNGTTAQITAAKLEAAQLGANYKISNDYVTGHDYGDIGEGAARKLLLRDVKDVQDYVNDVIVSNVVNLDLLNERLIVELKK